MSNKTLFSMSFNFSRLVPEMIDRIRHFRGESPQFYQTNWIRRDHVNPIIESQLEGADNMAFVIASYWIHCSFIDENVISM